MTKHLLVPEPVLALILINLYGRTPSRSAGCYLAMREDVWRKPDVGPT